MNLIKIEVSIDKLYIWFKIKKATIELNCNSIGPGLGREKQHLIVRQADRHKQLAVCLSECSIDQRKLKISL